MPHITSQTPPSYISPLFIIPKNTVPQPLLINNTQSIVENYLPGSFMVDLLIFYNNPPKKHHWAYFVRSQAEPDLGAIIHATGSNKNGFKFEIKRNYSLLKSSDSLFKRIPLQWIEAKSIDERAMLNNGQYMLDSVPVCDFEASVHKITPPGKGQLDNTKSIGKKHAVTQKDCQTWVIESAYQLVRDEIFHQDIVNYLQEIKQ